jgi:hypothetical protein
MGTTESTPGAIKKAPGASFLAEWKKQAKNKGEQAQCFVRFMGRLN